MKIKKNSSLTATLLALSSISLSSVDATRQFSSSTYTPPTSAPDFKTTPVAGREAKGIPASDPKAPSPMVTPTAPNQPLSPTLPRIDSKPAASPNITAPANVLPQATTLPTGYTSVGDFKKNFADTNGAGYENAAQVLISLLPNGTDKLSTGNIMDCLEAAAKPLTSTQSANRLHTKAQKQKAINLFSLFLGIANKGKQGSTLFGQKKEKLSSKTDSRFVPNILTDESKIEKWKTAAQNAPVAPLNLLNPFQKGSIAVNQATTALPAYAILVTDPDTAESTLKNLADLLEKRSPIAGDAFESYRIGYSLINEDSYNWRFKQDAIKDQMQMIVNNIITAARGNLAQDFAKAGFASRKEMRQACIKVLRYTQDRLATRLLQFTKSSPFISKAGLSNREQTSLAAIKELEAQKD